MALGLAQPQGIGQRPRQLVVDLGLGQPSSVVVQPSIRRSSDPTTLAPTIEEEWDAGGRQTRYFVVKPTAGSQAALEAAMSHTTGVWSFPPTTERKLTIAVETGVMVVAIFSVSGSGAFQGCAVFSGKTSTEGSRTGVRLEWMAATTAHFSNPSVN